MPASPAGFRVPGIVNKLVSASQLLLQAQGAKLASQELLHHLSGPAERLVSACDDLASELQEYRKVCD